MTQVRWAFTNSRMPDPVEELLNALVLIAAGGLSAKAHEKRATEAISRFNAERGDGVWVPRADLLTAGLSAAADWHEEQQSIAMDAIEVKAVRTLDRLDLAGFHEDCAADFRAMIAASEKADA